MAVLNEYMGSTIAIITIITALVGLVSWFIRLESRINVIEDLTGENQTNLLDVQKEIRGHISENDKEHESLAKEIYAKFAELKEVIAVSEKLIQGISYEQKSLRDYITLSIQNYERAEAKMEKMFEKIDARLSAIEGKK